MDKLTITGKTKLSGTIRVSGAKNVAMKVILAGLLTDEKIVIHNVPLISSIYGTADIVKPLGVKTKIGSDRILTIQGDGSGDYEVPMELGGLYRTATMVMGPLLSRFGKAVVPNPGGCRIGKRPVERHIEGLCKMGATITYKDGYFVAHTRKLYGTNYKFSRNSHTGTETLILAAVLAVGETVLENAGEEPEIDDLIVLLTQMGASIRRIKDRQIVIHGVEKLHGTEFTVMPDRNEVVTFAIAAIASGGDIVIQGTQRKYLKKFLHKLNSVKASWEPISQNETRFFASERLQATDVTTAPHPGFMTDWQAPWALLMTQSSGVSIIHETVYEDRFCYVNELIKMGADIEFFNPAVSNPKKFYNFNWEDRSPGSCHAIKIRGKVPLHDAILEVTDLRAGATLVLAAIIASGKSIIRGVEHIDRGYEQIEKRLTALGAKIKRERDVE